MNAQDIMTFVPHTVIPSDPRSQAAEFMRDHDVGFVAGVRDRKSMRLVGVITDRDIAVQHVADGRCTGCTVAQHMTAAVLFTVKPETSVSRLVDLMGREKVRRLPVTSGERLVGVIAQGDVVLRDRLSRDVGEMLVRISERSLHYLSAGSPRRG